MAFPTSGLTNNLVHKEGNRAFVYDSTLGVWDQIRETDRTENKIQSGTIGSGVTFPAGHVIQVVSPQTTPGQSASENSNSLVPVNVGGDDTTFGATITGVGASNWVQIYCTFVLAWWGPTSNEANAGVGILRADDSIIYGHSTNTTQHYQVNGGSYYAFDTLITINHLDKSPLTGKNSYYLGIMTDASGTYAAIRNSATYLPFEMTLMEIQQ